METPESRNEEDKIDNAFREVFFKAEDPGSYRGVEKLFRSEKEAGVTSVTRARLKQFLADQESYNLKNLQDGTSNRTPTMLMGLTLNGKLIWPIGRR